VFEKQNHRNMILHVILWENMKYSVKNQKEIGTVGISFTFLGITVTFVPQNEPKR